MISLAGTCPFAERKGLVKCVHAFNPKPGFTFLDCYHMIVKKKMD